MTKYAKCGTCGYTLAISDAMDAGDYVCPVDGTILVAATEADQYNAADKLVKLDENATLAMEARDITFSTGAMYYTDMHFRETHCEICELPFKKGEPVILVVVGASADSSKGKDTSTRPIHLKHMFEGNMLKNVLQKVKTKEAEKWKEN